MQENRIDTFFVLEYYLMADYFRDFDLGPLLFSVRSTTTVDLKSHSSFLYISIYRIFGSAVIRR